MTERPSDKTPTDEQAQGLLRRAPAGVDAAMQVLEQAELVYFGALSATAEPDTVTVTSTATPSTLTEPR